MFLKDFRENLTLARTCLRSSLIHSHDQKKLYMPLHWANEGHMCTLQALLEVQKNPNPVVFSDDAVKYFKASEINYKKAVENIDDEESKEITDMLNYCLAKVYYIQGAVLLDITPIDHADRPQVCLETSAAIVLKFS